MTLYERSGDDIDRGLVGYWKLDDLKTTGTLTAIDRINFNDGAITSATPITNHRGKTNEAIFFDGIDDLIDLDSNLQVGEVYSISLKIKFKDIISTNQLFIGRAGEIWSYYLDIDQLAFADDSTVYAVGSAVESNRWYSLVIIQNGRETSFYLDGVFHGSRTIAAWTSNFIDRFGQGDFGTDFKGDMANIRVHNRIITDGEISKLHRLRK